MEKKSILKKVNEGLKIATTVVASGIVLFGGITGLLSAQSKNPKKQETKIIDEYSTTESYKAFKEYEIKKHFQAFDNGEISLEDFENKIENLNSHETITNHLESSKDSEINAEYYDIINDREFIDDSINRGRIATAISIASTVGLLLAKSKVEQALKAIKKEELETETNTQEEEKTL